MPKGYTIKSLADCPDVLGDYPGEMQMLTYELDTEQVALTYRRMPQHTGGKGSYGHFHREQEEVYFVISGKLQFSSATRWSRPSRARRSAVLLRWSARSGTTSPRMPSS